MRCGCDGRRPRLLSAIFSSQRCIVQLLGWNSAKRLAWRCAMDTLSQQLSARALWVEESSLRSWHQHLHTSCPYMKIPKGSSALACARHLACEHLLTPSFSSQESDSGNRGILPLCGRGCQRGRRSFSSAHHSPVNTQCYPVSLPLAVDAAQFGFHSCLGSGCRRQSPSAPNSSAKTYRNESEKTSLCSFGRLGMGYLQMSTNGRSSVLCSNFGCPRD